MELLVHVDRELAGLLRHDAASNRFAFVYDANWLASPHAFPLSPHLPLARPAGESPDTHSAAVRIFFENLLPEGHALDDAARANGLSKSNFIGLLAALGQETGGALRVSRGQAAATSAPAVPGPDRWDARLRPISREELSNRIRERPALPFSVWDGKVRLSIAGYQDKIAIYLRDDAWYLVDDPRFASTHIVKPLPVDPRLASLPDNEHFCMTLARCVGLAVAETALVRVPEPVLLVRRFDRALEEDRVRRIHVIDGCQALGMPVSLKYERPYGDGRDVRDIRDGASFANLFPLLEESPHPALDRIALLRWAIFQVLIGNTDAHAKNVAFFQGIEGLRLAPAYDLVCMQALGHDALTDSYAMAIGDAFREADLTPWEWAAFATACGLPIRVVARELATLSKGVQNALPEAIARSREADSDAKTSQAIARIVSDNAARQGRMAAEVARLKPKDL